MSALKHATPKGPRRSAARVAAVQALYQMDLAGTDLNAVIDEFVTGRLPGRLDPGDGDSAKADPVGAALVADDAAFFAELLRGVVRLQKEIDVAVDGQLATGWRLARVDAILRAILRSGTFELIERADVPARVAISEYVEVAHDFFEGDEPKVVNGVLDKLARRLRPAEFKAVPEPSPERPKDAH